MDVSANKDVDGGVHVIGGSAYVTGGGVCVIGAVYVIGGSAYVTGGGVCVIGAGAHVIGAGATSSAVVFT